MTTLAEFHKKVQLARAMANKNSKYKLIVDPDEAANPYYLRRPCGIPQLDVDMAGGAPAGGITVISGPDSAGKTFLLYKYFAMCQKIYGPFSSILYAAVEFHPDYEFMRRVGCQVAMPIHMIEDTQRDRAYRRLPKLTKQEIAELRKQTGIVQILRTFTAEELLDKVRIAFKSNAYRIIAIDSISAIQSGAEAELDSLEDNPRQAANASLITRFMQRLHPLCVGLGDESNDTSIIMVAQARANRHKSEVASYYARYMKDWSPSSGAHALRHGKLVDVQLWAEGKESEGKGADKKVVGKTMKWTITKQKGGNHDNVSGEYTFLYDHPGDHLPALLSTSLRYGTAVERDGKLAFLHQQTGEVLLSPKDVPLGGLDGISGLREFLEKEPGAELAIMRELVAAAGIKQCVIYRREDD